MTPLSRRTVLAGAVATAAVAAMPAAPAAAVEAVAAEQMRILWSVKYSVAFADATSAARGFAEQAGPSLGWENEGGLVAPIRGVAFVDQPEPETSPEFIREMERVLHWLWPASSHGSHLCWTPPSNVVTDEDGHPLFTPTTPNSERGVAA